MLERRSSAAKEADGDFSCKHHRHEESVEVIRCEEALDKRELGSELAGAREHDYSDKHERLNID